jgi:hypothetical protein
VEQLDSISIAIYQIFEEIVLHVRLGKLTLQLLIHNIVLQRAQTKNGKVDLIKVLGHKVENFLVGSQLLMKIVGGKGQDGKASRLVFVVQDGQLFVVDLGFAS